MLDPAQIGMGVALLSVSIAVLKLNRSNGKNGQYVKKAECSIIEKELKEGIHQRIDDLKDAMNTGFESVNNRLDDFKDLIK